MLRQQDVLEKDNSINTSNFKVDFKPKTDTQAAACRAWDDGHHLLMHGYAGTGKTYVGMALALEEVLKNHYKKISSSKKCSAYKGYWFLAWHSQTENGSL